MNISGGTGWKRSGSISRPKAPRAGAQFQEMMVDATGEDPPFRQILVHDMGQLSRWAGGVNTLQDRLEANGATVVSVTVGPEPRPPEHKPDPWSLTQRKGTGWTITGRLPIPGCSGAMP